MERIVTVVGVLLSMAVPRAQTMSVDATAIPSTPSSHPRVYVRRAEIPTVHIRSACTDMKIKSP